MFTEPELIVALKAGQPRAVNYWYRHYLADLMTIAQQKVESPKDAEELVQETFINALRQISLFQGKSSLKTWLVSILRHEIADFYRKKYAKKALKLLPLGEQLLAQPVEDSAELNEDVRRALGQMLQKWQVILWLKYVDGLSVKQISAKVGRSFKAVETDLYRARQSFRKTYLALQEKES